MRVKLLDIPALAPDFTEMELACPCCGELPEVDLVEKLQELRTEIGEPVFITSCARCLHHNKAVGGAENSYHLQGLAVDAYLKNWNVERAFELFNAAWNVGFRGFGVPKKDFIHLDLRLKRSLFGY